MQQIMTLNMLKAKFNTTGEWGSKWMDIADASIAEKLTLMF